MCLLAVEDELSSAVVRRLLRNHPVASNGCMVAGLRGFGYLKANLGNYMQVAKNVRPVFMLTDLDHSICAPSLMAAWFQGASMPRQFLFCVAVREVESWLLADRTAMAAFLDVSEAKITRDVESISGPKEYLLKLASRAPRDIRRDLLPAKNAVASQGFGYNSRMGQFVEQYWSPERGGEICSSLKRAMDRIATWGIEAS